MIEPRLLCKFLALLGLVLWTSLATFRVEPLPRRSKIGFGLMIAGGFIGSFLVD